MKTGIGVLIGVIAAAVVLLALTAFTVRQTEQALILQFGNPVRVIRDPGLHFKLPWPIQNVEYYPKFVLSLDPPSQEVLLADQKRIIADSFIRFRIVDPLEFRKRAVTLTNFLQIFGARMNAEMRGEVARASLADLLSDKRVSIMGRIAARLREQAPQFGVDVLDVRLGRADLPEAAIQAVYNRMRSERIAQAAQLRAEGEQQKARIQAEADRERTVILAEANRQAQILRGTGDAQRTLILNAAYGQDVAFFDFFRSLEAYTALQGSNTTMVLNRDSDFFRFFLNERGPAAVETAQ